MIVVVGMFTGNTMEITVDWLLVSNDATVSVLMNWIEAFNMLDRPAVLMLSSPEVRSLLRDVSLAGPPVVLVVHAELVVVVYEHLAVLTTVIVVVVVNVVHLVVVEVLVKVVEALIVAI